MDLLTSNRIVVLALLLICGAMLVTPVLGGTPQIVSWGYDGDGQVSGTPAGTGYTAVSAGWEHSLAVRADGSIVSWGNNGDGQVSSTPTGTGYTAVAAGYYHSLALRADGSIVSWGYNGDGQVSSTPTGTGYTAVAAGGWHSLALRADGSIAGWGNNVFGQVWGMPAGTGYTAIDAGYGHSLALRADGSIASWGCDDAGQVSGTPTGTGYTAVAAGYYHSLALRADGSIVSWGDDGDGQVSETPAGTGYTAIDAGYGHSLALRADGSIAGWGNNQYGEVSSAPGGTGFTAVAGGYRHSLALRAPVPAPVADFTANVTTGAAPLAVQFTDASSGDGITGRTWDFGDGTSTSTELNPTHTYSAAGTYNVSLAVTGEGGTDTETKTGYITVTVPAPVVDLEAEVSIDGGATWLDADTAPGPYLLQGGPAPLFRYTVRNTGTVNLPDLQVTDSVLGVVITCSPFSVGSMARGQALVSWAAGQYTSTATVTSTFSGQTALDTDAIYYFGADPKLAIKVSTNGVDANAAPGPSITIGSPVTWTYQVTNTGNVALTNVAVIDDKGVAVSAPKTSLSPGESMTATASGTAVLGQYENIGTVTGTPPAGLAAVTASDPSHYLGIGPPAANFTANVTRGTAPLAVSFTDASSGTVSSRSWAFGDGGTSTETDPTYVYTAAGTYTVNLTVTGAAGTDTETKPGLITVSPAVLAVPPGTLLPTDLNSDGKYEDVNGNGAKDFNDIVLFFNQLKWIIANEPVPAFDYNGNARIDFGDVVWLFNNL